MWRLLASLALAGTVPLRAPVRAPLPPSSLAVWGDAGWREWWNSSRAPARWNEADGTLTASLTWRPIAPGIEWAETRISGSGEAWRLRLIVVRIDPRQAMVSLDTAFTRDRSRAAWSIDDAPPDALVALNAGQFGRSLPWGWVQLNGREFLPPGRGPLSTGLAIDSTGHAVWISGNSIDDVSARRGAKFGFQSYPTLLHNDGEVPAALRSSGGGIDVAHRDARLAIGGMPDGRLVIALTRFDGAGSALDFVPFGLTTPEMSAVMGALGSRHAVMLDGGISSQLLIRDPAGTRRWPGLRAVPLALLVRARDA